MMKLLRVKFALLLAISGLPLLPGIAHADLSTKPIVNYFKMTPDSVELNSSNRTVKFELSLTNPGGIYSNQIKVKFSDGQNNLFTYLIKDQNASITNNQTTIFMGNLELPASLNNGVYSAIADPVIGLNIDGSIGFSTDYINATTTTKLVGAPNTVSVRRDGNLDFSYQTFVGPTYDKTRGYSYLNSKYTNQVAPIWKVGETFNPIDYYELKVPDLILKINSSTPTTCQVENNLLKLTALGGCIFTVFTDKTENYRKLVSDQSVNIGPARTKPTYVIGTIPTQSSAKLPLSISGPFVYGPLGLITPSSSTPNVCNAVGTYINIISGGTCKLNYFSESTSEYLASDIYTLIFEISRTAQTISFTLPATVSLTAGRVNLTATASSGSPVTFESKSPSVCDVQGSTLRLKKAGNCDVAATQSGTTTVAPISALQTLKVTSPIASKKIICIKNGKIKTFLSKKCPTGYKQKK